LEVRTKRVGVNPMLEKDQPQRILGIVVDRVEQASPLQPMSTLTTPALASTG
jgi:hypothetical protein